MVDIASPSSRPSERKRALARATMASIARLQAGIEHRGVALHVVGRGVVFLVVGWAVVALAIVLEHDLPVGLHHVVDLVGDLGALDGVRLHLAPDGGQRVGEVGRRVAERDEQQPGRVHDRDRPQRQLGLVDAELAARVEHQRAVELVGPAVIGADQAVGVALLGLADARAAMAADIVEGADLAVAVAHHDDRFGAHLVGEEVARPGHLEGVAGEQPMAVKNPCQIGVEDLRCDVKIALQRSAGPVLGDQAGDLRRDGVAGLERRAVHSCLLLGRAYHAALARPQTHVKVLRSGRNENIMWGV